MKYKLEIHTLRANGICTETINSLLQIENVEYYLQPYKLRDCHHSVIPHEFKIPYSAIGHEAECNPKPTAACNIVIDTAKKILESSRWEYYFEWGLETVRLGYAPIMYVYYFNSSLGLYVR